MRLHSLVVSLLLFPACITANGLQNTRADELRNMLLQDCGSCHGLTLKGGLGPALLPGDLREKPEDYLVATILYGRPGTPMPPWRPFLTAEEARWMAQLLKEGVK
jgi:cytochrome c55X